MKHSKPMVAKKGLGTHEPLRAKATLKANPKPKKQAKPMVSKLKKEADKWFSKYVRFRDGNVCITCGTVGEKGMQAGHFQSRRYNSTRYEEENVNAQCYRCNVLFYGEQYKYANEVDLKYGTGTATKLAKLAATPHQFTIEELQQIISDARTQVDFYLSQ